MSSEIKCKPRVVKDYEIDYNYTGQRNLYVNGICHSVMEGDICFRSPGQSAYSTGAQDSYLLTIDFTNTRDDENYGREIAGAQQILCTNELICNLPTVIRPSEHNYFNGIFADIAAESQRNSPQTHSLIEELIFLLNACVKHNQYLHNKPVPKISTAIQQYITMNFNQKISLDILSEHFCIEKNYMVRLFKKEFGRTPIDYQISQRIYHSRYMLLNTTLTIKEIGEYCGYNTPSLFIRHFKRTYGKTPMEYRKCNDFSN